MQSDDDVAYPEHSGIKVDSDVNFLAHLNEDKRVRLWQAVQSDCPLTSASMVDVWHGFTRYLSIKELLGPVSLVSLKYSTNFWKYLAGLQILFWNCQRTHSLILPPPPLHPTWSPLQILLLHWCWLHQTHLCWWHVLHQRRPHRPLQTLRFRGWRVGDRSALWTGGGAGWGKVCHESGEDQSAVWRRWWIEGYWERVFCGSELWSSYAVNVLC